MNTSFQNPQTVSVSSLSLAFNSIRQALTRAVATDEAASRLLLRSQDGSIFLVTISNEGVLSAVPFVR